MGLALRHAVRTHPGLVRERNEDAVLASARLVAVADGVGGHAAGEVASATVIEALAELPDDAPLGDALADAVRAGNAALRQVVQARPQCAGMGTTLTAVGFDGDYVVANIGDSRTYLLRDGELTQLTRDDSWVQELIDAGQLRPEDARDHPRRSVVLAALDGEPQRRPTVTRVEAQPGDRLLLCSDGLSDAVEDEAVRDALGREDREAAVDALLRLALDAGGHDNITVVVADLA